MTAAPGPQLTPIDHEEIQAGDSLIIDRDGRPAVIDVAEVRSARHSLYDHPGYWDGGTIDVAVTTADGAVLNFWENPSGGWESHDDFGSIIRRDPDSAAVLLSDIAILDPLAATEPAERDIYDGFDDGDCEELTSRQRDVLKRLLKAYRQATDGIVTRVSAQTVAATTGDALTADIGKVREALASITDALIDIKSHPRFPRSTADRFDTAIRIAHESSEGAPSWPDDRHHFIKWPESYRALLIQDWAAATGVDLASGPQIPLSEIRPLMELMRRLRASAKLVAVNAAAALEIQSTPKALTAHIQQVVDQALTVAGATP